MTDNHPITPPPELVKKWGAMLEYCEDTDVFSDIARWGADQELEACCEWLTSQGLAHFPMQGMLEARRPKPPALKEQAMAALDDAVMRGDCITISDALPKIRRALEALPE